MGRQDFRRHSQPRPMSWLSKYLQDTSETILSVVIMLLLAVRVCVHRMPSLCLQRRTEYF